MNRFGDDIEWDKTIIMEGEGRREMNVDLYSAHR
jgi:hypothetical protein